MRYRFSGFELNVSKRELLANGTVRPLEPQVFDLLHLLIERRERIVTKEDIIDEIWNGRAISDAAVSSRIRSARQAIGDDGRRQSLIKTHHGVGFRFIGEVTPIVGHPTETVPETLSSEAVARTSHRASSEDSAEQFSNPARRPIIVWACLVFIVFSVVGVMALNGSRWSDREPTGSPETLPFETAASIAVIPFKTFDPSNPETRYMADLIVDRIVTRLSYVEDLNVRSASSSFRFDPQNSDRVIRAAEALDVDYVLEGSLRLEDDRIIMVSRLVNTANGQTVWSREFDRQNDPASLIALESGTVAALAQTLDVTTRSDFPIGRLSESPKARTAMARATQAYDRPMTIDSLTTSIAFFTEAIQADPSLADAIAKRIIARIQLSNFEDHDIELLLEQAKDDLRRAKRINPDLTSVRLAEALIAFHAKDPESLSFFNRLLAVEPHEVYGLYYRSHIYSHWLDQPDNALNDLELAREIDPLNPYILRALAQFYENSGRYADALRVAKTNVEWNPFTPDAYRYLIASYESTGDFSSAYHYLKLARERGVEDVWIDFSMTGWSFVYEGPQEALEYSDSEKGLAAFHAMNGDVEKARSILWSMQDPFDVLEVVFILGDYDRMAERLSEIGALDALTDYVRPFDPNHTMIIMEQEKIMQKMVIHMIIDAAEHPSADDLAAEIRNDLTQLQGQPLFSEMFTILAGWFINQGQLDDAISVLERQAREMGYPGPQWTYFPSFEPLKSHPDYNRVAQLFFDNRDDVMRQLKANNSQ